MSNTQQKADSIKSKEYINLLKAYFQTLKPIIGEKQLLYFILGINLGLKSKDLLSLQWYDILNNDYTIKDHIERNEYKLYLNKACKEAIQHNIEISNDYQLYVYVFGYNQRQMNIATFNGWYIRFTKKYNLSIHITTESLRKTFIYWQIKEHGNDPIKMYKLQDMMYRDKNNIYDISQYIIENDYNYFNDINL